jgi:glucose-1-phosphate cytidylyltransferase
VEFHRDQGTLATVTAVQPPGRYGALTIEQERIRRFEEKPDGDGAWINGGFFVLSAGVGEYIEGDSSVWEREPMSRLADEAQMASFRHTGFWHAVDTLRDKNHLEALWQAGDAPWKTWA